MRYYLIALVLFANAAHAITACPATSGPLTLSCAATRTTGVSPLEVWFDCSATTDSSLAANFTPTQRVNFSWNYGDSGSSGQGNWLYGVKSAYTSKNLATGIIGAHLYITSGANATYTPIVRASDGTNSAQCSLSVTVTDPTQSGGFNGANTTCVSSSGTPVAGSGGCPASATVQNTSSVAAAISAHLGAGKRVLFKCGDTFTSDIANISGVKWSVGAYGSPDCSGTQSNRPIFNVSTSNYHFQVNPGAGDGRITDIDCENTGSSGGCVEANNSALVSIPYQITLFNLKSSGNSAGYFWNAGAQWAIVQSTQANSGSSIVMYINPGQNNPGAWVGTFPNLDYQAAMGNSFHGAGPVGGNIETFRVGACRFCVITNNDIADSANGGAIFKLHNGDTYNSCFQGAGAGLCPNSGTAGGAYPCVGTPNAFFATATCWTGVYSEKVEFSDNYLFGNSAGQIAEFGPQNGVSDERVRDVVVERNLFKGPTGADGGRQVLLTGQNITVRNNVFNFAPQVASSKDVLFGVQVTARGSNNPYASQFLDIYNNTCYSDIVRAGQACIALDSFTQSPPAGANSIITNNLYFAPSNQTTVDNAGSGNTVGTNTSNSSLNPGFINISGLLNQIYDFKPTANFSPGTAIASVPYDALGQAMGTDLGAVHH